MSSLRSILRRIFSLNFLFFFTFPVTKSFQSKVKNETSMSIYLFDYFICFQTNSFSSGFTIFRKLKFDGVSRQIFPDGDRNFRHDYNREMQRIRFFFVQRSISFVSFIRLARHSKRTEQFVNIRSRLYIGVGIEWSFFRIEQDLVRGNRFERIVRDEFDPPRMNFSLYRTIIYKT